MILIFQAVLAAEPSTYALATPVALPPAGAVRVALGPELVGGEPERLEGGLLLADASGRAVPYAVITSSRGGGTSTEDLFFRPTGGREWETEPTDAPVDALVLDIMDLSGLGPVDATVSWPGGRAPKQLLYQLDTHEGRTIELPHVKGPFTIELAAVNGGVPRLFDVSSVRYAPDHVPPIVEEVPLSEPLLTESGNARYTLRLLGTRAVTALRFELPETEDVFERTVSVRAAGTPDYGAATGTIRRIRVGNATVDQVEVPVSGVVGDTLVVEVQLNRGEALPLDAIDVVSEGAYLVARDAGAGPHTLYGGATEYAASYDLSIAIPDLLRAPTPLITPETAGPNPIYVPLPTRENVDEPGPDLSLARFHYERDVIAQPGWARIAIDRDVLARTREDLADVRIVDAQGRQVPFLLAQTGEEAPWDPGELQREEKGNVTRLRLDLPGTVPVKSVQIETSANVFQREVTILRDAGRSTVALRHVSWRGPARGGTLVVDLDQRVGDALLVEIDNGDNPPLPIEAVRVSTPVWEVRARIPEGGARLVYGAAGASAPVYDLELLNEEVRRLPVPDATLGDERPLTAPAPRLVDRALTAVGIVLLVVGLLGMVVRVLRGVPPSAPPEAAAGA